MKHLQQETLGWEAVGFESQKGPQRSTRVHQSLRQGVSFSKVTAMIEI